MFRTTDSMKTGFSEKKTSYDCVFDVVVVVTVVVEVKTRNIEIRQK
jgi:hypothetical protein